LDGKLDELQIIASKSEQARKKWKEYQDKLLQDFHNNINQLAD